MRILLIEHDRLLAKNVAAALEKAGHAVDAQVEAQEAIAAADTHKPDLVIMDFLLAGRSGVEFLYEFRSYDDWADVPAIIYTSLPEAEARDFIDELEKLGVKHYFHKPSTSLNQLVEAVNQL